MFKERKNCLTLKKNEKNHWSCLTTGSVSVYTACAIADLVFINNNVLDHVLSDFLQPFRTADFGFVKYVYMQHYSLVYVYAYIALCPLKL